MMAMITMITTMMIMTTTSIVNSGSSDKDSDPNNSGSDDNDSDPNKNNDNKIGSAQVRAYDDRAQH